MSYIGVLACLLLVVVHGSFQARHEDPRLIMLKKINEAINDYEKIDARYNSEDEPDASEAVVSERIFLNILDKIINRIRNGRHHGKNEPQPSVWMQVPPPTAPPVYAPPPPPPPPPVYAPPPPPPPPVYAPPPPQQQQQQPPPAAYPPQQQQQQPPPATG